MNKLPTIKQIISGELDLPEKQTALNVLLNQQPPKDWLKTNKFAGNSEYLPIDKIEYLLTKIFNDWFVRINNVRMFGNSIETSITLFYRPIIDELQEDINNTSDDNLRTELIKIKHTRKKEDWYDKQDGTGAAVIQVEAGEKASSFDKIKPYAIAIAAPKAESVAISDAADKIGRVFGKDLNRNSLLPYDSLLDNERFKNILKDE